MLHPVATLQKLADDAPRAQRERATEMIVHEGVRIDAQRMEHRGMNIDRIDRAAWWGRRGFCPRRRSPPAAHSAPRQQHRLAGPPMVASGRGIDLGRPAEFSHDDHQRLIQRAKTRGEIIEQRRQALIEHRQ